MLPSMMGLFSEQLEICKDKTRNYSKASGRCRGFFPIETRTALLGRTGAQNANITIKNAKNALYSA